MMMPMCIVWRRPKYGKRMHFTTCMSHCKLHTFAVNVAFIINKYRAYLCCDYCQNDSDRHEMWARVNEMCAIWWCFNKDSKTGDITQHAERQKKKRSTHQQRDDVHKCKEMCSIRWIYHHAVLIWTYGSPPLFGTQCVGMRMYQSVARMPNNETGGRPILLYVLARIHVRVSYYEYKLSFYLSYVRRIHIPH